MVRLKEKYVGWSNRENRVRDKYSRMVKAMKQEEAQAELDRLDEKRIERLKLRARRGDREARRLLGLTPEPKYRKKQRVVKRLKRRDKGYRVGPIRKFIKMMPWYDPYKDAGDKYYFDKKAALKAINFFEEELVHTKGSKAGQPFLLEDWQKGFIANLFGWREKKTGYRRYREVFLEVARKNGKSPLAAGIILYLLTEDGEPGAEIYGAAGEYKQAAIIWEYARGMVEANPSLSEKCKIYRGQGKSIELMKDHSIYQVVSADAYSKHGYNASGIIVDELHTQPNRELVDVLTTSTAARAQPIIVYITTRDFDQESICNETEERALKIAKGEIVDPQFLPCVYIPDERDDWKDKSTWHKANPNLGVSVSREYLDREFIKAKNTPAYENTFKRLHLNIKTQADVVWLDIEAWDECNAQMPLDVFTGEECTMGIDLSSKTDLSSMVLLFKYGRKYVAFPYFWMPEDKLEEKEKRDHVSYFTWARQNNIILTPGEVIDYSYVRAAVVEAFRRFHVTDITFDPWNFAAVRQQLILQDGLPEEVFVEFPQRVSTYNDPCKEMESLILQRRIIHNNHPILRWNAQNVVVLRDHNENYFPSKKKSAKRIDGITALLMALGVTLSKNEEDIDYNTLFKNRGIASVSGSAA